ncbi:MAG: hypothetical protein WA672_10840 [Candidatus Angelobacter sp.]
MRNKCRVNKETSSFLSAEGPRRSVAECADKIIITHQSRRARSAAHQNCWPSVVSTGRSYQLQYKGQELGVP